MPQLLGYPASEKSIGYICDCGDTGFVLPCLPNCDKCGKRLWETLLEMLREKINGKPQPADTNTLLDFWP